MEVRRIKIGDLIPTHNSIRDYESVIHWVLKIHAGEEIPPLAISEIPNDILHSNFFLRDGHHRAYALFLTKSDNYVLKESEFVLDHITREEYKTINRECGYVTPFDIVTECRRHYSKKFLQDQTDEYILANSWIYKSAREVNSLKDLWVFYEID